MSVRYKIDSVSNMYPALGGLVYRQSAVFKEPVNPDILRAAVRSVAPRFPIMCSHLEHTFFGYAHVPATDLDVVTEGEPFFNVPAMFDTDQPSFRLYVRGNRVTMDVFHGNGDGCAGIAFLAALSADYLLLARGLPPVEAPAPSKADLDDPYVLYYKRARSANLFEKGSYKIHLSYPEEYWYARFSCISVDLNSAKNFTKAHAITVNDLLCGALALAIFRVTDAKNGDLPVTISAPIDLRKHYNSHSQRNFVFYGNLRATKENAVDLAQMATQMHTLMQTASSDEALRRGVAVTYKAANNIAVQYSPRVLREWIVRKAYRHVAGNSITTTLTNVGYQTLPQEVADGLERFEMYLGPGRGSINAAATGYGDKISLCITCGSEETVIEDAVQAILKENGIESTRDSFAYRNRDLIV